MNLQQATTTVVLLHNAPQQPCGCPECDSGVREGHFACAPSSPALVHLEREGYLVRYYNGTSWVWERTNKRIPGEWKDDLVRKAV